MKDNLINRKQLAKELNVHPDTIRYWERKERIKPTEYFAGHPKYDIKQVKKALTTKPPQK